MARPFFTVSFLHTNGAESVSRIFSTLGAARKWAKWLTSHAYVVRATVYRGPAGGEVVA